MVKFKSWKTLTESHNKSWNFKSLKEYEPCYVNIHFNKRCQMKALQA